MSTTRLRVLPNFVDDAGFIEGAVPSNRWAYIGRLSEEKGILDIARRWPEAVPLHVYGDGALRVELEAAALRNSAIRMHGAVASVEVSGILRSVRGTVFPSKCQESAVPMSYLESIVAGRPVIALEGNGASDDVRTSGSGVIVNDVSSLSAAIEEVSGDWSNYSRRARHRYEEAYSSEVWVDSIERLYESLV